MPMLIGSGPGTRSRASDPTNKPRTASRIRKRNSDTTPRLPTPPLVKTPGREARECAGATTDLHWSIWSACKISCPLRPNRREGAARGLDCVAGCLGHDCRAGLPVRRRLAHGPRLDAAFSEPLSPPVLARQKRADAVVDRVPHGCERRYDQRSEPASEPCDPALRRQGARAAIARACGSAPSLDGLHRLHRPHRAHRLIGHGT